MMNEKERELHRIIDVVVGCCVTGEMSVTRDEVLGRSRRENVVMTRCILAEQIVAAGYSVGTAAMVMGRTVQAVRHMLLAGGELVRVSRAYRIAREEAMGRVKGKG